ncbi:MAG TPA: BON domain-containing protein [Terriglobia bacterium]|nr:BON domain-containing protein [Terriglobia bacterium]
MKTVSLILCAVLLLYSAPYVAMQDEVPFPVYVDSDICARLMLGPITTARVDCSVQTHKDGSNPVLVRLDDNTVFDPNKPKLVKDHVGGFGEATGEVKVKSGTMKLKNFKPLDRKDIPEGPSTKLLDVRTYKATGNAQLHEKIRHELAMIAYITTFDFISFTLVGNDVILTGWTVRDTNRSDAEYRVKKIEGVNKVTNNIEILPLGGTDMEIRAAARLALQRNLSTYFWSNGSDIKIIVKNGIVILLGSVRTQQDFDIATIQTNSVSFVFHVFNLLRVTGPEQKEKKG